jgi:predicted GIY-YIG superfamily endonuclease
MIRKQPRQWQQYLESTLKTLLESTAVTFAEMTPLMLPKRAGVYLITVINNGEEEPYYIGRTTNIRRRLYTNHLMGPTSNSQFKKYLIESGECKDLEEAKQFLRQFGKARWIEESNMRKRGAIEGYLTGVLFPKYGICQEH